MIEKYESLASDLLEWIEQTIIILNNRKFANSLVGVQQQLQAFNTYRTVEKPPKSEPLPSVHLLHPVSSSPSYSYTLTPLCALIFSLDRQVFDPAAGHKSVCCQAEYLDYEPENIRSVWRMRRL